MSTLRFTIPDSSIEEARKFARAFAEDAKLPLEVISVEQAPSNPDAACLVTYSLQHDRQSDGEGLDPAHVGVYRDVYRRFGRNGTNPIIREERE